MATPITCFKAYDIRGELNSQLTEDVAYRIGYAFAQELNAKTVVVGIRRKYRHLGAFHNSIYFELAL